MTGAQPLKTHLTVSEKHPILVVSIEFTNTVNWLINDINNAMLEDVEEQVPLKQWTTNCVRRIRAQSQQKRLREFTKWLIIIPILLYTAHGGVFLCILAWTEGCGHWLGSCPRPELEAQRGSPCPERGALFWSAGSLAVGRGSCGLEPAPDPPPWETTRKQNKWSEVHHFRKFSHFISFNVVFQLFYLFQWRLSGFLWDADLTAAGQSLWLRRGFSPLKVASL